MHVAINTRFLLPGKLEGIGWFSHEILRHLVALQPDWRFTFIFDRPYDPKVIFAPNVEAIVLRPPARHPALFVIWFELAIPRLLKRLNADVFISTDGYFSLRASTPGLLFWHDLSYLYHPGQVSRLQQWYYAFFVPRFLKKADRIITFSQHAGLDIFERFAISADKLTVSSGAPRPGFGPLSPTQITEVRQRVAEGKPYFLYTGAIHPRKNIDGLIRAFDHFKRATKSDFKLVLVGRMAWQTDKVKKALDLSDFRKDIVLTGHLEHGLEDITASAHTMVYPSFYEGFGLPIIEAIQSGVPVITSNCASMPEVAGMAGILIDPHDDHDIATAMRKIVYEPGLYDQLVHACALQAAKFSWEKTALDVRDCLNLYFVKN